ncbi:GreA/GreB family elongation factor [Sphingomonas sp. 28-63-12]|uniref:GreA/GreB family elongation factor n=1 Tax=Sphingomonas sp. 28-63-12 TaxID=1970434 RepID=UPI000BC45B07|nr:MAG: nucleoside-diphosphate kinase [Sphingomonas sp. 28-63-12]
MSVAFRRESDEEHLEPKFELPIPPGPNLVTTAGLAIIEAKLATVEALIASAPEELVLADAKRQWRYWITRKTSAQLAPPPPLDRVAFGSRVRFTLNGALRSVTLVGSDEADTATDKIPFTAPLARALIGGEVGEALDFGGRADAIEILGIEGTDSAPWPIS